jgi:hypothetical protein
MFIMCERIGRRVPLGLVCHGGPEEEDGND